MEGKKEEIKGGIEEKEEKKKEDLKVKRLMRKRGRTEEKGRDERSKK
jgi:hypothetical protein